MINGSITNMKRTCKNNVEINYTAYINMITWLLNIEKWYFRCSRVVIESKGL